MARYGEALDQAIAKWSSPQANTFDLVTLSAPPQHGKTATTEAGLLKAIQVPAGRGKHHMYVSYSQSRSESVSKELRLLATELGIEIEGTVDEWYIPATKSKIVWTSIGGRGSGEPVTGLLVIDDPYRDFPAARSVAIREQVRAWIVGVGLRRLHTTSTVLEMGTRWHEADLTAWLIETYQCPYLNIQGICEDEDDGTGRKAGDPLFPQVQPIEMLQKQRQASPVEFESQYQGRPRPMGDALFDEPARYDQLPATAFRSGYGLDLAYSTRTVADWSVVIKGRLYDSSLYVMAMDRRQLVANKFLPFLKLLYNSERGPMRWYYGGGGELGVSSFISAEVPNLVAIPATVDKVVRSLKVRQGWNLKRILLPSESSPYYGSWVEVLRREAMLFTGLNDPHDDIVDALAALWDQLTGASVDWAAHERLKAKLPSWRF